MHLVRADYVSRNKLKTIERFNSASCAGGKLSSNHCCEIPLKAKNGDIFIITAQVVKILTNRVSALDPAVAAKELGVDKVIFDNTLDNISDLGTRC